jgi:hypothetical protein
MQAIAAELEEMRFLHNQLLERAERGDVPADMYLNALRETAKRGKPVLPAYIRWRTFNKGTDQLPVLFERFAQDGSKISIFDEAVFNDSHLVATQVPLEAFDTVLMRPCDFGHQEPVPAFELLSPWRLQEWSKLNLDGEVIELLSAEDPFYIRDQYRDQPRGEEIWCATEPLPLSDSNCLLVLDYGWEPEDSDYWIYNEDVDSSTMIEPGQVLLFRIRKVASLQAAA